MRSLERFSPQSCSFPQEESLHSIGRSAKGSGPQAKLRLAVNKIGISLILGYDHGRMIDES